MEVDDPSELGQAGLLPFHPEDGPLLRVSSLLALNAMESLRFEHVFLTLSTACVGKRDVCVRQGARESEG